MPPPKKFSVVSQSLKYNNEQKLNNITSQQGKRSWPECSKMEVDEQKRKSLPFNPSVPSKHNIAPKHSFIPDEEIVAMIHSNNIHVENKEIDKNNNEFQSSQESLNAAFNTPVNIINVYMTQKMAFDKLNGTRLVEDVLLKGKYWRDHFSEAEYIKDEVMIYGLKIRFRNISLKDMSKKRFFACLHLHNAIKNYGIRSALAVHIDLTHIKHKEVYELSKIMIQLVGDGYNFFALQFKIKQTTEFGKKVFNKPGMFGIYIGFAFILDYLAYRNTCKKRRVSVEYNIKQYVEFLGHTGCVISGVHKSAGSTLFDYEYNEFDEELNLEYCGHLFDGVRFIF